MAKKSRLLFYCQHSLGMGHLVRALRLASVLSEEFDVVFLNGGRFPPGMVPPARVEIIEIPPLGMGEDHQLFSQDDHYSLEAALLLRRRRILDAFAKRQPDVVLIELFPFGRKKFAGELLPLLKAARRLGSQRPLVLCSLRDIMVNARKDQLRHDDRARWLVDRYFDGILVHSDPRFARLDESFRPRLPLQIPVYYTGFVMPSGQHGANARRERRVIVSAGGGMVGAPLFRAALEAQQSLWQAQRLPMTLVAGPFLPEVDWRELQAAVRISPGLVLHRSVPNLGALLETYTASVSQCGYNTTMDILSSGIPALVVPFARGQEDEQSNRARRLAQLGLVRLLDPADLNSERLALEISALSSFTPRLAVLDLNGAENTVRIVQDLVASRPGDIETTSVPHTRIKSAHV